MSDDPYQYPGTTVLRNRLEIKDQKELTKFESEHAELRTDEARNLTGPFNLDRLQKVHWTLFRDTYDWAGKLRENTGSMDKGRDAGYVVSYGPSAFVEQQAKDVFARLEKENYLKGLTPEKFSERLAYFYGEWDAAHCFRDGNSRALRLFTSSLAKAAGHDLEWSRVLTGEADRQRLFHARDLAVMRGDITQLTEVIASALAPQERQHALAQSLDAITPSGTHLAPADAVLTGTGETRLPNLDYANRLLDRVFREPSGRNLIKAMSDSLQPGEQRVERIKNMFALAIAGVRGQSATYTITPVPGKAEELSDLLRSLDSKEISIEPKRQRRGKGHDIER
jgi:fido (protein-threonine AMPylation protein)